MVFPLITEKSRKNIGLFRGLSTSWLKLLDFKASLIYYEIFIFWKKYFVAWLDTLWEFGSAFLIPRSSTNVNIDQVNFRWSKWICYLWPHIVFSKNVKKWPRKSRQFERRYRKAWRIWKWRKIGAEMENLDVNYFKNLRRHILHICLHFCNRTFIRFLPSFRWKFSQWNYRRYSR